jgi:hypothetical protein
LDQTCFGAERRLGADDRSLFQGIRRHGTYVSHSVSEGGYSLTCTLLNQVGLRTIGDLVSYNCSYRAALLNQGRPCASHGAVRASTDDWARSPHDS